MPAVTSATAEQFLALPDRFDSYGNRIKEELIDGEIVLMAPPSKRHDLVKNRIARILARYIDTEQLDLEVLVETAYQVSVQNVDIPDVSIVHRSRLQAESRIITGAPDIAVEVISPSETAAHIKSKVDVYLANGSQSVWIVYPDQQSVIVHAADGIREVKGSHSIQESLLPGFQMTVSAFFER